MAGENAAPAAAAAPAPAAPPASPGNFDAVVQANVARSQQSSAPAQQTPATVTRLPHPQTAQPVPAALEQPPANDNAQPVEPLPELQLPDGDPLAEQIHGMQLRAIVDAIKNGELPAELLEHVRVPVKLGGEDGFVSAQEAGRGYMRISDYTRGTQQIAKDVGQIERIKGQLRSVLEGFDKPEGFEQRMDEWGLRSLANGMVTKNWMTAAPDGSRQPNVAAFREDMRRLGMHDVFRAAAIAYATEHSQRMNHFMGPNQYTDQQQYDAAYQRAKQLVLGMEGNEDGLWTQRLAAEAEAEKLKRANWKTEQERLLAARQQQPQDTTQLQREVNQLAAESLQKLGYRIDQPHAFEYFDSHLTALVVAARRLGLQKTTAEFVADAVQATAEDLAKERAIRGGQRPGGAAGLAQGALPAQPTAAPTTAPGSRKKGGSLADFNEYTAYLDEQERKRRNGGR